jgi:hypothetical protein
MNRLLRKKIVFHAGAVMTLGMLSGIPLAMTMLGYMPGEPADWKISHMEGLINGLLMLAVAGCGGLLALSFRQERVLLGCLLFTGYSNALYGWMRGLSGEHGMDFAPPVANQIVALLGGLPIATAFASIIILMLGAHKARPEEK